MFCFGICVTRQSTFRRATQTFLCLLCVSVNVLLTLVKAIRSGQIILGFEYLFKKRKLYQLVLDDFRTSWNRSHQWFLCSFLSCLDSFLHRVPSVSPALHLNIMPPDVIRLAFPSSCPGDYVLQFVFVTFLSASAAFVFEWNPDLRVSS